MDRLSPLAAFFASALCLAAFFTADTARAQERDAPKAEVGAHFTSLEFNPPTFFGTSTEPGVGGRFAYNVTDYLGLEAEVNFLPKRSFFGRTTQGQFGAKVGKRFRKFGVFAKARPGFVSFDEVSAVVGTTSFTGTNGQVFVVPVFGVERRTHLSVDVGGVLEFYPSRKLLVRVDAGDTVIRYKPETLPPGVLRFDFPVEGVSHNFQLTTGVAYRFMNPAGADEADPPAPEGRTPRFEAGVQYAALVVNPPTEFFGMPVIGSPSLFTEPAVGGRLTFNLNDSVALEAALDFMTKEHTTTAAFGGRGIQGQFGVKAGRRFERFGLFAKARPGFLTFSRVHRQTGTQSINFFGDGNIEIATFGTGRKTHFESDFGGVAEFYPTRRVVARFDAGDTVIWYRDRVTPGFSIRNSVIRLPAETKHNFQFSAGLAVRF